jgi:sporulation protein YlmC with PRC-barrel domain
MGIKIVLPEGDGFKIGYGTKVYTSGGVEISGVSRITIDIGVETIITAIIEVNVDGIENADGIAALLPPDEAKKVIEWAARSSMPMAS